MVISRILSVIGGVGIYLLIEFGLNIPFIEKPLECICIAFSLALVWAILMAKYDYLWQKRKE